MAINLPPAKYLVVDDDETMLTFLKRFLHQQDATAVLVARTGEEALLLAEAEQPDLIILDVQMPGANGLNVLRRLRESPKTAGIRVLFATGLSDFRPLCDELHANAVIYKPYSQRQLHEQIARLLLTDKLTHSPKSLACAA